MKSSLRSDEIFGVPPQMKLNPSSYPDEVGFHYEVYHQPCEAVSHHALAGISLAARSCFNYEPENIDFTNCAIDLKIFLKNAPIVAKKPFFEVLFMLDPGSFKGVFPSLRSVK